MSVVSWGSTPPPLAHSLYPKLWALEAPVGALVLKTTYAPMINTALYVMRLMQADPLLGLVGGGLALEISTFWAPNGTRLMA